MKLFYLSALFLMSFQIGYGQIIKGKVLDTNGKPLEYVNIGIVGTSRGSVSDQNGAFEFNSGGESADSKVRFSMIGYKARVFQLQELLLHNKEVVLEFAPKELPEVVISGKKGKLKKIGETRNSLFGRVEVFGWGGTQFGEGNEIGTLINAGDSWVRVKSLNIKLFYQTFDSSLFRLHIREYQNNTPGKELINDNIYLTVKQEKGWLTFDLSRYNIFVKGTLAVTIEWVNVFGLNKEKILTVNNQKGAYVLFNTSKNKGITVTRWGSENDWMIKQGQRIPNIYLLIEE